MSEKSSAAEGIASLREAWKHDPSIQRRLNRAMDAFREYASVRAKHVALTRVPASEYDDAAVRVADRARTAAHNSAIRAAASLNEICAMGGFEPVAPVPPKGIDPFASKGHRRAVARFVAEVLELGPDKVEALDL